MAQRAVSCAIPRTGVGVGERALKLGVDDRVDVASLVAAGVANRPLALGVGAPPAAVTGRYRLRTLPPRAMTRRIGS